MDKDLFKVLKELKNIQPDLDYSKQSRLLLLAQTRNDAEKDAELRGNIFRVFYPAKLALAVGIVILILVISGGVYYINNQLNQNDLVVKASEMNASIQVKLNEIRYLLKNNPQPDTESILAIQVLLEKAANELKEVSALGDKDLNESLKKIDSTREILYQIDDILKNK
ncbi:hypothetical protein CO087_01060 [Candidatus Wolfebacteria bacterium CG_4_9_14_0_8_um_filter_39_46]|uniref:DUF5667 domain-containing protein n=1 Tax=Candidatus Wolfebacteria bacterium CG_4_9_14_0_8_um_filter_39_46 TaxID=1975064 RepID=A0A2M8D9B5_9BACT|nr:MAG: hypothetical protein CO087_01060 [Candidatus Wolfebacteria bacterium CG_4_9_14_0_8_um_filter_39_46]